MERRRERLSAAEEEKERGGEKVREGKNDRVERENEKGE